MHDTIENNDANMKDVNDRLQQLLERDFGDLLPKEVTDESQ